MSKTIPSVGRQRSNNVRSSSLAPWTASLTSPEKRAGRTKSQANPSAERVIRAGETPSSRARVSRSSEAARATSFACFQLSNRASNSARVAGTAIGRTPASGAFPLGGRLHPPSSARRMTDEGDVLPESFPFGASHPTSSVACGDTFPSRGRLFFATAPRSLYLSISFTNSSRTNSS